MELKWNIFPGFNTLQLSEEVKSLLLRLGARHQRISQEESHSCQCSTTYPVEQKTTKQNVWQTPNSSLCTREDLEKDNGHLLVVVLRKSGLLQVKTRQSTRNLGQSGRKDVVGIR